ncbi:MAG: hypothetical protein HQM12_08400 [SAR324 cluster bacterium]|nr:hypothetical protein [SAR324 cluster bacterium]
MSSILDYEISEQLYESANSLIYRAVHSKTRQPVVLKRRREDYPLLVESDERLQSWKKAILQGVGENGAVLTEIIPTVCSPACFFLQNRGREGGS